MQGNRPRIGQVMLTRRMVPDMSFEGDKARLVQELADMQKLIRAEYDVAPSAAPSVAEPAKPSAPTNRAGLTAV